MSVLGIDVSYWNMWENDAAAWDQGARFVIMRLGSINNITGECYQDFNLEAYLEMISESPRPWAYAGYWFWRLNHSAQKQADYIAGLVEMANRDYGLTIRVVAVDDEIQAYFTGYQTAQACQAVEATTPARALLYSNYNVWTYYRTGDKSAILDFDHWPAQWGTFMPTPWEPYRTDGQVPALWQYSADGNGLGATYGNDLAAGGTHDMDLNWFFGTEQQMYDYFENEEPAPPLPPELPARVRVVTDKAVLPAVDLRSAPGWVQGNRVGQINKDAIVEVDGLATAPDGSQFYEVRLFLAKWMTEPAE